MGAVTGATGGTVASAPPAGQDLDQRLEALRAAVNRTVSFGPGGELTGGQAELRALVKFLLENKEKYARDGSLVSQEALARGLPESNGAQVRQKRQESVALLAEEVKQQSAAAGGVTAPAAPVNAELVRKLQALQSAANQHVAFDSNGSLTAGKDQLTKLAQFFVDNRGKLGSFESKEVLSQEAWHRGLSGANQGEELQKRKDSVNAFLSSLKLGSQGSGTASGSGSSSGAAQPSNGGAATAAGTGTSNTVVDTLTINNGVSAIGLFSKKENIEILHTQAATGTAPAVTVFINKTDPQTAYITVSRVGADGKLTVTEIAAVGSADVLGSEGSRPKKLAATIWTPGASGKPATNKIGEMDISGFTEADFAKMQDSLKIKLKPKAAPQPAPAGSAAPEAPREQGGGSGKGGSPQGAPAPAGAASGGSAPQQTTFLPDGKLDKSEGMLLLKTPGVLEKLKAEFRQGVVQSDKDEVEIALPDARVRIKWKDGASEVVYQNVSEERRAFWLKEFEKRLQRVINGAT